MQLRFLEQAETELDWAAAYADAELPGRGSRLVTDFEEVIDWALTFPHSGKVIEEIDEGIELRAFLLGRFPYTVLLAVLHDQLVVIAIAHHSREPGYWMERIGAL